MEESKKIPVNSRRLKVGGQPPLVIAFGFLFLAISSSSFAQQTNEAIQQGNEAYKKGDYNTALKEYAKALQADKKNTVAQFNKGNAQQRNNDAANAAGSYDEVINNTDDADLRSKAYYNKALAMLQQKNLEEAITALKQSLRLAPADNDTRENLQKALNEKKQQQQQQEQNQSTNTKQQQPPQQPKQKQPKMNKQMMEQKFNELRNQEKELQKQLQQQKNNQQQQEKDW